MDRSSKRRKLDELHTLGYKIYPNFFNVSNDLVVQVKKQSQKSARPIFNGSRNDNRRKQCTLNTRRNVVNLLSEKANEFFHKEFPFLFPSDFVVLHSLKDCEEQLAHTDYVPSKELLNCPNEKMPLLALIALEAGTSLTIWSGAIKYNPSSPVFSQKVSLNPGDLLIFRGDLVHAGSAYEEENVRLHCYLDSPDVPRVKNRTWVVRKDAKTSMRELIIQ